MKKKQGLLVMLLGCLVTVSAIAGVLVWQGTGKKDEENRQYEQTDGSSEQLLWNDEETTGTEEETTKAVTETQKTTQEARATETKAQEETRLEAEARHETEAPAESEEAPSEAPAAVSQVQAVSFQEENGLLWPVEGNVIMEYSMDKTVYFPTLDLYKCSPAVLIQGEAGMPVTAAANSIVKVVGTDAELGNYVTLDLGNGYELTYGQLTDPQVNPGDYLEAGAVVGTLAEPTKYYVVEGANLYFQMTKDGAPIDPLDFVDYAED
ncbi:MAG: peptidoglycan DD-metalloendopeptidase family protein [Lachnospiraceae bacterium]|nr:peptidoglycan DD-metalloendopeptidase family protein [Lachnospiraceae bacterium]